MLELLCEMKRVISPDCIQLTIPIVDYQAAEAYCKKQTGHTLVCKFTRRVRNRTTGELSQNHAINGAVQQIANMSGHTFDEIKTIAKHRAISRGYPLQVDYRGEPIISPVTGKVMPKSETEIDRREAGYLIETLQQIAAELGINLRGFYE